MAASVIIGNGIQDDMRRLGIVAYAAQFGAIGWLRFLFFAFGFPVGLAIGSLGVMIFEGPSRKGLLYLGGPVLGSAASAILVPSVAGSQASPLFFNVGGWFILAFVVATMWLWGARRAKLPAASRFALDLHGTGHLCFAIAAWNLCGVGGMPSFALAPEIMVATGSQAFAVGQMKTVMVLLVVGWALTAFGSYISNKNT